jgi:hypothetical protein
MPIRLVDSKPHLRHPESWCALATLAPDIGRQSPAVRKRLDGVLSSYMQRLAKYMPGESEAERRKNFIVLFSGMAGSMAMARACGDKEMRTRILSTTRDHYLATFASEPRKTYEGPVPPSAAQGELPGST